MPNYKKINQIVVFLIAFSVLYSGLAYGAAQSKAEDFLFDLGKQFYEQGDYQAALHEFDKVLFLNPQHAPTLRYIELITGEKPAAPEIKAAPVETQIKPLTEAPSETNIEPVKVESVNVEPAKEEFSIPAKPLEYIISEEDVLNVTVLEILTSKKEKPEQLKDAKKEKEKEYTIGIGDVLDISVWRWPDLAKDVIVRPDGKISFPLVGDIDTDGLTLTQLDDILTKKLSEYVKSPEVSVMVKSFGSRHEGEKIATTNVPTAPFARVAELCGELAVRPDGKISMPLVGDLQASGMSLPELREEIKDRIKKYFKETDVTLAVRTFGGRKIIILGEVTSPGVYRPTTSISAVEAIALAGGYTEDAILNSVLIVRGDLINPQAIRLDLNKAIKKGDLRDNIVIQPRDIIYVPRNFIKNVNYFLENMITPLLTSAEAVPAIRGIRIGTSTKKGNQ